MVRTARVVLTAFRHQLLVHDFGSEHTHQFRNASRFRADISGKIRFSVQPTDYLAISSSKLSCSIRIWSAMAPAASS